MAVITDPTKTGIYAPDEKARKSLEDILLESRAASEKSERFALISLALTSIAVICAVVSAYYSTKVSNDSLWQKQQIEALQSIINSNKETQALLIKEYEQDNKNKSELLEATNNIVKAIQANKALNSDAQKTRAR